MSNDENEAGDLEIDQGFVLIANDILRKCKINGEVKSLKECLDSYFVAIYEGILGERIVGVTTNAISRENRIENCNVVIDALSHDVLNVDLSHITGENIVDGDITTIQNLLEIFKELLDFILDVDDGFGSDNDEKNDSNLLSSGHEVISDVLQEELGPQDRAGHHSSISDAFTLGEPEVSSIPKCSEVIPSLQSSDVESHSTDEIIRESELLEHQLSREYPLLARRQALDKTRQKPEKRKDRITENLPTVVPDATVRDGKRSDGKAQVEDVHSATVWDTNLPQTRRLDGISETVDNIPVGYDGAMRDTYVHSRGIDEHNMGSSVPKTGIRLGDVSAEVDSVDPLRDQFKIPTARQVDPCGRFGTSKDVGGLIERQNAGDRSYLRNDERDRGFVYDGERGVHHRLGQEKYRDDSVQNRMDDRTEIVGNHKEASMLGAGTKETAVLVRKSELTSQEGQSVPSLALKRADGKRSVKSNVPSENDLRISTGSKKGLSKTRESSKGASRISGKPPDFRENRRHGNVEGRSRAFAMGTYGVSWGGRLSSEDSCVRSAGRSGKENKRPQGVLRDKKGSRVKRKGKKDVHDGSEGRRMRGNVGTSGIEDEQDRVKDRTNSSDTSGVFWDDQISPLDASEGLRNPRQGLAFDEVGLAKKTTKYDAREGMGTSKDSRDSPVVRHYHHHFHHGSSEDLVGDLALSERTQRFGKQIADSRDKRGLGSSKTADHAPRKAAPMKEDVATCRKRSVKFDDHVDTMLITNRLERLRREMELQDEEENERRSHLKDAYSGCLGRMNKEHKRMEKKLKQAAKKSKRPSPYRKKRSVTVQSRDGTQGVHGKASTQRRARYPSSKARKRSSSASPKIRHDKKAAKQLEKGDMILPTLLDDFPFLHLSPHALQTMRRKQTAQLTSLSKSAQSETRHTRTQKVLEDAEKRQETLLKILRKDLQHNQRMREQKERVEQERAIKSKLREKRHASARARRYYEDYQLRMRARMLKRRTKEEQIFKNLFVDGLEIQKQRVHELRTYAKEQRETRAKKQQNELESLENYYRDQYSLLAEAIAQEKEALLVREKAQEKVIKQMQRNLREKLQKEVTDIQETLVRDEDDAYFRRLDAERLRRQLQMTAFQNLK